jgi:hypothetical protein
VHDAYDFLTRHQRHAHQRTHALLIEERVHRLTGLEVVDHHRALLLRDASGEAGADAHGEALPHLLFQAARRARPERLPVGLDEKDRDRVDVQDLDDPLEQGVEQFVELEVRERGLGYPLDVGRAQGATAYLAFRSAPVAVAG